MIAGSESVPDALQKCHSLSRDLQNNQTIIFTKLFDLKQQINNFTIQVTHHKRLAERNHSFYKISFIPFVVFPQLAHVQQGLHKVQQCFQAAPELVNMPALSSSVVTFGSQIRDLKATLNSLKETNVKVQNAQTAIQQNISSIQVNTIVVVNRRFPFSDTSRASYLRYIG